MKYAALGATAILTISSQPVATRTLSAQERRGSGHPALGVPVRDGPFRAFTRRRSPTPAKRLVAAWFGEHARARQTSASGYPGTPRAHGPHRRGRDRRPSRRDAPSVLEPCALRDARSVALALLQGWPRSAQLVGMVRASKDAGQTWGEDDGCPTGSLGRSRTSRSARGWDDHQPKQQRVQRQAEPWRIHFERSADNGSTWTIARPPVVAGAPELQAIQPSILVYPGGRLQAVGRTRSERVFQAWSEDGDDVGGANPHDAAEPSSGTDARSRTAGN